MGVPVVVAAPDVVSDPAAVTNPGVEILPLWVRPASLYLSGLGWLGRPARAPGNRPDAPSFFGGTSALGETLARDTVV